MCGSVHSNFDEHECIMQMIVLLCLLHSCIKVKSDYLFDEQYHIMSLNYDTGSEI